MSEHRFPFRLQHCPGLHWFCKHKDNPHEIYVDCVGILGLQWIVDFLQSWLYWIVAGFSRLFGDCNGLQLCNRLCIPQNPHAIHIIRLQSKIGVLGVARGLRGSGGTSFREFSPSKIVYFQFQSLFLGAYFVSYTILMDSSSFFIKINQIDAIR